MSNELSSENGQSLGDSGSKDNCSDCNEAKGFTPELEERKATGSPEHAEEIPSSVKIRYKFEGSIDEKESRRFLAKRKEARKQGSRKY